MLTIRRTQVFQGPGIWAPVPAIVLEVDIGELEARLSRETPVFFERLIALVPSLHDARDLVHQPEGGLRRLLLDRLALALQHLVRSQVDVTQWHRAVGAELTYAQTQPTAESGVYRVVYAYEHEEVGLAAGRLAVRLLNHLLGNSEPDFDFARELDDARRAGQAPCLPLDDRHRRGCGRAARHPGAAAAAALRDESDHRATRERVPISGASCGARSPRRPA